MIDRNSGDPVPARPPLTQETLGLLGIVFVLVIAGLAAFHSNPVLVIAVIMVAGGAILIRWPDVTTLLVIGLVYSNLPVVAVQFHGAPKSLPAAVLALLGWPLIHRILIRREPIRMCSAFPWVLCFFGVQVAGASLAEQPSIAFEHLVSFVFEGLLVYLLITNLIHSRQMLRGTLWVLALCGVLMGGAPLVQQLSGWSDFNLWGLAQADSAFSAGETAVAGKILQTRAAGTIGEQNRYAQFMLVLIPLGLALGAAEATPIRRNLARGAAILALLGAALAFSRGAAVACIMAFLVAAWLKMIDRSQWRLMLGALLLMLVLLPQYMKRLASITTVVSATQGASLDQTDGAVRGRLTEMGAALLVFRDHPLVGVGPGMFTEYSQSYGQIIGLRPLESGRQAHSLPLDIAAENGILGLLGLGGLILTLMQQLLRAREHALTRNDLPGAQHVAGVLMAVLLYLAAGLFLHLSYIRYFWLLIAVADSAAQVVFVREHVPDAESLRRMPASPDGAIA